jgi:hypothetical protein
MFNPLCRPLYALGCLLVQGQAKMKLVAAWMRKLLTFLVSWGLTNIMIELPVAFRNAAETWGAYFLIIVCLKFWAHYHVLKSMPTAGSWWCQQGVMADSHCYSWSRWWSDTLWVPHKIMTALIFLVSVLVGWNGHNSCLQTVIVQFSLQTHRHTILGLSHLCRNLYFLLSAY